MATVLLVWPFYPPEVGAASLRGAAFARGLRELDVDVHVLAPAKEGLDAADPGATALPEDVPVHRAPLFFDPGDVLRWPRARRAIRTHLRELEPDLVVASTPPPMVGWQLLGPLRRAGVPLVVDARDLFTLYMRVSHGDKLRYAVSDRMEHRLYHAADAVLAVSELLGDQLAERYDVPRTRVHVARNGTDLGAYEELPNVERDLDVTFLGNFEEGRRGADLLRAYRGVLERRPETTFAFVGWRENALTHRLQPLWDAPPLRDHLVLQPPVPFPEVPTWLARSRVGVLSLPDDESYAANVARKTYDYLAAGVPMVVLGPDVDAELRRLLHTHDAGVYAGSVEAFEDALVELLEDPDRWAELSRNARELGQRFDLERIVERTWRDVLAPLTR